MTKKVNIIFGVICGVVIIFCAFFYSVYVSQIYYDIQNPYPTVEDYSAKVVKEAPEGYLTYSDDDGGKVVEVSWYFTNTVNEKIYMDIMYIGADYYDEDGGWLYVMEREEGYSAISKYDNRRILPPGEHVVVKEYVQVPEDAQEIEAYFGSGYGQGTREGYRITF